MIARMDGYIREGKQAYTAIYFPCISNLTAPHQRRLDPDLRRLSYTSESRGDKIKRYGGSVSPVL